MKRGKIKRVLLFLVIGAITSWLALWLCLKFEVDELVEDVPYNTEVKTFLLKNLVKVDPLNSSSYESTSESLDVVYVMGGAQENLTYRLKTTADLYHRGIGKKILILSRPGITEYDPRIGRNLTNDEWATRQLVENGINKEDIELISLEEGFFGTFTEARGVSALVLKRDYKHLILVTSPSHTKRVWMTFSRFFESQDILLNIYAGNDHANLRELLLEYSKLIFYKYILIPVYSTGGPDIFHHNYFILERN